MLREIQSEVRINLRQLLFRFATLTVVPALSQTFSFGQLFHHLGRTERQYLLNFMLFFSNYRLKLKVLLNSNRESLTSRTSNHLSNNQPNIPISNCSFFIKLTEFGGI